jgi:hypothetical protein
MTQSGHRQLLYLQSRTGLPGGGEALLQTMKIDATDAKHWLDRADGGTRLMHFDQLVRRRPIELPLRLAVARPRTCARKREYKPAATV